jgi:muconate cycloisomerase
MKISALEIFRIKVDLLTPYQMSKVLGSRIETQAIILKIHTNKGIFGLGEANPAPLVGGETTDSVIAAIKTFFAPLLLGANPLDAAKLEIALDRVIAGNNAAKAAVSVALFDILAKAEKVPLHLIFGGKLHSELPVMWPLSCGSPIGDDKIIEEKLKIGHTTFMIKMGAQDVERDIERVSAIREKYGNGIHLISDTNQGWNYRETLSFINGLEAKAIDLMEQPMPIENLEGYKSVCRVSPWPVSVDESIYTIHDARRLISEKAANAFSLKVSKHGGLLKTKNIAIFSEVFGINCLMNSEIEFGISQAALLQLGCTLNNLVDFGHAYMSPLRLADDITDYSRLVNDGKVRVPDTPGLGVDLDEEKLSLYTQDHFKFNE